MKKFVIKHKARIWRYITAIVLLCILLFVLFIYHQQCLVNINKEKLQLLANENAEQINLFLDEQKEKLIILSKVHDFIEVILHPNDIAKFNKAEHIINELKNSIPGISILTNDGIVIIGDIDRPGTDYGSDPYFTEKREDTMLTKHWDPLRLNEYYAVITSVYDEADKNKIIGRVAFDIELEKIGELFERASDNKYGEVYLIDSEGLLLSGSKYLVKDSNKGILVQEVKTNESGECLGDLVKYGKDGKIDEHKEKVEIKPYLNYMGDEVYGAHAYVSQIMGCVVAEKGADDVSELSLIDFIKNMFNKIGNKIYEDKN